MTHHGAFAPELAIASNNPGKVVELRALLGGEIRIVSLADLGLESPEETGDSFAANAVLKARHVFDAAGVPTLADDSGLEIDALGGAPGVHSARYAGDHADDAANRRRLLEVLQHVPAPKRLARFVCVIAVVDAHGHITLSRGSCEGSITFEERGRGGFGYDSLFELPDGRTMAELSSIEKNRISHRAAAIRLAVPRVRLAVGSVDHAGETGQP